MFPAYGHQRRPKLSGRNDAGFVFRQRKCRRIIVDVFHLHDDLREVDLAPAIRGGDDERILRDTFLVKGDEGGDDACARRGEGLDETATIKISYHEYNFFALEYLISVVVFSLYIDHCVYYLKYLIKY